jgi:hypothetical protein
MKCGSASVRECVSAEVDETKDLSRGGRSFVFS